MKNPYADVLAMQNACNASGVMMSAPAFAEAIGSELNHFGLYSSPRFRFHPIAVLFANKLADLTGQFSSDDGNLYSLAYGLALKLRGAEGDENPIIQRSAEHKAAILDYYKTIGCDS